MVKAVKAWAPNRQDVIWIDCNPRRGQQMRDGRSALVLSPKVFNERASLVIRLRMTTAAYSADNPFAEAVGAAGGARPGEPVTCSAISPNPLTGVWAAAYHIR
jgi:mRNA interferase MazF